MDLHFNSLQSGKSIQTYHGCIDYTRWVWFQFPSIGKVHPNLNVAPDSTVAVGRFQFPSIGKVHPNPAIEFGKQRGRAASFNSLQSGKSIQTGSTVTFAGVQGSAFQFPSIGKVHPNEMKSTLDALKCQVSIPFNRESPSKLQTQSHHGEEGEKVSIPFNRESPSKLGGTGVSDHSLYKVSIPFNRESPSKLRKRRKYMYSVKVSIPFNRESPSKLVRIT